MIEIPNLQTKIEIWPENKTGKWIVSQHQNHSNLSHVFAECPDKQVAQAFADFLNKKRRFAKIFARKASKK